jgi:hypothetical protein
MNEQTIRAKVNPRLLTKADRLFTGTVEGRVIEILQNARRAKATEVRISNKDSFVTVEDNGTGIEDFQKLLDLGGSDWDEKLEAGEDPAGVGLFSMAPREVTITSKDRQIVIDKDGWTGKPVAVTKLSTAINGTIVKFKDDQPWDMELVEKHAVFAGIRVIVDGRYCHRMPFCGNKAAFHSDPGCRIEVVTELSKYHSQWKSLYYRDKVLVNFHGQIVLLDYWPGKNCHGLTVLVDIADQTNIRLMLPARTQLVENAAFEKLKAAIELEYYKYFKRQKTHTLYYEEYLRAKELGIELQEAEPQFKVGLISGEYNEPVEITIPKNFKVADGYLFSEDDCKDETARTNAHLLAALGKFKDSQFVPVEINGGYIGYNWTKLPRVTKVEVLKGFEKLRYGINGGEIACFDKLAITVHASDGKIFNSYVDMAVIALPTKGNYQWEDELVCVTKEAKKNLSPENIWFHLGGYSDEGDGFDTQLYYFGKELNEFWNELIGPYETVRQQLVKELNPLYKKWQKITIFSDESLEIVFKDGRRQRINPPAESA